MDEEGPAIGIDLGTTYSCAAVLVNDQIKIIHGDDGRGIMASCVLFNDSGDRVIGNTAKEQSIKNYSSSVFGIKRIIGRTFEEYKTLESPILFPFEVREIEGKPIICVTQSKKEICFAPEEISAMVLVKLKERAEEVLRKNVTKAVITVPAHFNGSQRQATRHAGEIAGLNVLRIINEPTAAALAYELDNKYDSRECNILVYDFGGGTFDVSIVKIFHGILDVKATNGEPFLGGDDIDKRITEHFIKEFKNINNIDITTNKIAVRRLHQQAEKAKIQLSSNLSVDIELDYLHQDIHFSTTLNRAKFERLNADIFKKTLKCVQNTLKDAKMEKIAIDEIVLIGGTTRIPYIIDMVKKYFNKEPNASVHPDEAVAIGAARQAALSEKSKSLLVQTLKLSDVCSLSLGIECQGDVMHVLIPRNEKIPSTRVQSFSLDEGQTNVRITIYEGERSLITDHRKLGEFILNGLQKTTTGQVVIKVTFSLDEDGILHVVAEEQDGQQKKEIVVDMNKNQLSAAEIKEMITKAEIFRKEDEKRKQNVLARMDLQTFYYNIQKIIDESEELDLTSREAILNKCDEIENWLDENKLLSQEDIEQTKEELFILCQPSLEQIKINITR